MSATPSDPALLPIADGRRTRAVLRELLRPHRLAATAAALALIAATAISLVAAPTLGRVVDLVVDGKPASDVTPLVLILVGVALGEALLAAVGIALVCRVGETMLAALRERFVARTLALPLARVEAGGSGDLTSRVTNDISRISEAVREAVPTFVRAVLMIGLTLVGLAALDWRFLLAALVGTPIQIITARWYVRRSGPLYGRHRIANGAVQQELLEATTGAATVRALGLGDAHRDRVLDKLEGEMGMTRAIVRLHSQFFGRLNLAELAGLSAVLLVGYFLVGADAVTIGTATAGALYFANLFGPINEALFLLDAVQSATASCARLVGVLDLAEEAEPPAPARSRDGELRVSAVSHAYRPGRPVLRGVDLVVPEGARVALVGASGAGKTTLAALIAGVHRPSSGTIAVGGATLDALGPRRTREAVALVTQEVHVFSGTLAADLRLARPEADDDALRAALDVVGALDWAQGLPEGLETVVGDGAHELTVVQAQQVALARLVLADPRVAVLDEATAEAGSAGSRVLEKAALAALEGRTSLVVAHRLTQAATADRIAVMDAGVVVEEGTHEELVAAGGRYAKLWSAWSGRDAGVSSS